MTAKNEISIRLSTLGTKEWSWLERFLASPYHVTDGRLRQLAELLRWAPDHQLEPTDNYSLFFPTKPFSARKWGDLLRKFLLALRSFLQQQQLRRDSLAMTRLELDALRARKLYALSPPHLLTFETAVTTGSLTPWESANAQRERWQRKYEHPADTPALEHLHRAVKHNRLLYCLLELRYGIEYRIRMGPPTGKESSSDHALPILAARLATHWPILELYLAVYTTLGTSRPLPADIAQCRTIYFNCFPTLHPDDRSFFFTKLSVLFNRSVEVGDPGARTDMFELYRFAVAEGIFLAGERMNEGTFLNICNLGIALEAFDWVHNFREAYLPRLANAELTHVKLLSQALLEFGRGNFEQVYILTGQAKRLPLAHRLRMYAIELKARTELYLLDQQPAAVFQSYLASADRFLRYHQKAPARTKRALLALVKVLRRLIALRELKKPAVLQEILRKMVDESDHIGAREWLHEKIAQL